MSASKVVRGASSWSKGPGSGLQWLASPGSCETVSSDSAAEVPAGFSSADETLAISDADLKPDATEVLEAWSCLHFSVANPRADGDTALPRLLRRLAGKLEERGIEAGDILDVTIESEITEDGPWWSASVYWSPDRPPVTA